MPEFGAFDDIVAQLTEPALLDGHRWNSASVTFSFSTEVSSDSLSNPDSSSFSAFSQQQIEATRLVVAAFGDVIDIAFTEVSGAGGNDGDIRFANYLGGQNTGYAGFPGPGTGGDVFISITEVPEDWPDLSAPFVGGHAFLTYLHELGHAMGLYHMGDYNGGSPSYLEDALFAQDTEQYSVMSYFQSQDAQNGNDHFRPDGVHVFAQTLMLYDIAALQATYGANLTTRSGATVYGFNSTSALESPYNFAANPYPVICIYDAGGRDRIDFSGFTGPTRINLAPGSFSDTQDLAQNVSIAFGTVIEGATGGLGQDWISGNGVANSLRGLAGGDILLGRNGDDLLFGGLGNDTVSGGSGNDTVAGGSGGDLFVFSAAPLLPSGFDTILDFNPHADRIRLDVDTFADLGLWAARKFHASATGQAHDASDRIILETDTGRLFYDADGNLQGGVGRVQIAVLTNLPSLEWSDISLG